MSTECHPIGTQVIVFAVDGKTKLGNGVIEKWVKFSEIPEEDEEEPANTGCIGIRNSVDLSEIQITLEDGSEVSAEEALEGDDMLTPFIRLNDGTSTYGCACYYRTVEEDQEHEQN